MQTVTGIEDSIREVDVQRGLTLQLVAARHLHMRIPITADVVLKLKNDDDGIGDANTILAGFACEYLDAAKVITHVLRLQTVPGRWQHQTCRGEFPRSLDRAIVQDVREYRRQELAKGGVAYARVSGVFLCSCERGS